MPRTNDHGDVALRHRRANALARMRAMVHEGKIDFSAIGYPDEQTDDAGEATHAASPAGPPTATQA
ncbi:hypothetical protein [Kitasatospora sp. NPDC056531]|uniref:hypothetical protein n=1 Tax=Kitasatospora sp. NPDC056531 TaxID=3345856 RepID=UPI0036A9650A